MRFKVGDKVKFLNETGGGIVSKIVSGSLVYVATEDGFELPTSTADIIILNPESKAEKMFSEDFDVDLSKTASESMPDPVSFPSRRVKSNAEETRGFILLLFPPTSNGISPVKLKYGSSIIAGMTSCTIFCYRMMTSNILVSIMVLSKQAPQPLIDTIDREGLPGWTDGIVQILVHSEEDILPASARFFSY